MKRITTRLTAAAAFSLVEVALALGVAGFCLVSVVALLPVGVSSSQSAVDQTAGSEILTHVLADLRATPTAVASGGVATSQQYKINIPAPGIGIPAPTPTTIYFGSSSQQFSYSSTQSSFNQFTSRYRLTVTFLAAPAASDLPTGASSLPLKTATKALLLVTWPPMIDPTTPTKGLPSGRVQLFTALDRN